MVFDFLLEGVLVGEAESGLFELFCEVLVELVEAFELGLEVGCGCEHL